jgi:hypothetical protein
MFLFIKAKYFCYNFFDLSIKIFFLYLNRLLVRHKKYLVPLIIIASLVLTNILGAINIFRIGDNYIIIRLIVEINGFLIAGIQGYLVSVPFDIIS